MSDETRGFKVAEELLFSIPPGDTVVFERDLAGNLRLVRERTIGNRTFRVEHELSPSKVEGLDHDGQLAWFIGSTSREIEAGINKAINT